MRARLAATPFCCGLHTFCSAIHFRRWFSSVAGCHPFLCKNFSAMLTALEPAGKHTRAWVDGSCHHAWRRNIFVFWVSFGIRLSKIVRFRARDGGSRRVAAANSSRWL